MSFGSGIVSYETLPIRPSGTKRLGSTAARCFVAFAKVSTSAIICFATESGASARSRHCAFAKVARRVVVRRRIAPSKSSSGSVVTPMRPYRLCSGRHLDARAGGREHRHEPRLGQLVEMAPGDAQQDVAREAGKRERALRGEHVADLLPRRLHELVLVAANDLGAPARRHPVARLQADKPSSQCRLSCAPSTMCRFAGNSP